MGDYVCKIERLANGYEVEITDPKIVAANKKSTGLSKGWKDPKVCYAFKTIKEVLAFLEKNLDKALPLDEYESSFDMAAKNEEEDE